MDKLKLFEEILSEYESNNYYLNQQKMFELLDNKEHNFEKLTINVVLEIVKFCNFSIEIYKINGTENYDDIEKINQFFKDKKINLDMDFMDFLKEYTKKGYYVKFEVKDEDLYKESCNHCLTGFVYLGKED